MLDRLVARTWSDETMTRSRSAIGIVLYFVAGLSWAALALFGDGGGNRVVWGLCAVVFVGLGVTLAVHRMRRTRSCDPLTRE